MPIAPCARRSKVTDGPVVNLPVPYCHNYWTVPKVNRQNFHYFFLLSIDLVQFLIRSKKRYEKIWSCKMMRCD